jgi:hypothetical protein
MEDKVAKLSERAPEAARMLVKRVVFAVIASIAVLAARKLVDKLWERATGELPPTKVMWEDEADGMPAPSACPRISFVVDFIH